MGFVSCRILRVSACGVAVSPHFPAGSAELVHSLFRFPIAAHLSFVMLSKRMHLQVVPPLAGGNCCASTWLVWSPLNPHLRDAITLKTTTFMTATAVAVLVLKHSDLCLLQIIRIPGHGVLVGSRSCNFTISTLEGLRCGVLPAAGDDK